MPWNIDAVRCVVQCVADQASLTRVAGNQRDLAVGGHTAVGDAAHSAPNALICIGSYAHSRGTLSSTWPIVRFPSVPNWLSSLRLSCLITANRRIPTVTPVKTCQTQCKP